MQLSHQYFFTHLGSACKKAARRTLMKLTQEEGEAKKVVHACYTGK